MSPELDGKARELVACIARMERVAVAFSGGVDSALVLAAAVRALGPERSVGVIGISPSLPRRELDAALRLGRELGARVEALETHELEREGYRANGPDRCYHCKTELYTVLGRYAEAHGRPVILDGTNADDRLDLRPGHRAARELGVRSPLLEVGLGKEEIRELSRSWGITVWRKPASPCLSSRIPQLVEVTVQKLGAIEEAEAWIAALGVEGFRVRHHGEVARLELDPRDWDRVLEPQTRAALVRKLRELGFRHVSLDLDGFRSGSLTHSPKES
ncbi:MAG TPA: ATP-dependent sacrificial sulfur transferase LarE [Candidatus Saccharimonadales bacterium]|nr:ATP-dependent sacrificial sulfur transferase LarE [Candidatus Saccharimonadales bacterium]